MDYLVVQGMLHARGLVGEPGSLFSTVHEAFAAAAGAAAQRGSAAGWCAGGS